MGSLAEFDSSKKHVQKKIIPAKLSSYLMLFLKSDTCRESCYSCKYACNDRVGDLTIGDYWGIQIEHPDYLSVNGGNLNEKNGISCILVNSHQGQKMIEKFGTDLMMEKSDFVKVSNENGQLKSPSSKGNDREIVLALYKAGGYAAVEKWYNKKLGIKKPLYEIWNKIPEEIKNFIRKFK